MNIEQAKKLLRKGKELGDEDLINMALEILDNSEEFKKLVIVDSLIGCSGVDIRKTTDLPRSPKELPDFTMKKNPNKDGKKAARAEPIGGFTNKWVDEGEHKDIITPQYTPTPRDRPEVKPQRLKCAECGRVVEQIIIHSMEAEFYRCSDCKRVK